MKTPALRVTKWLADIPVEACCSFCPNQIFRATSTHHRPEKTEYQKQLQGAFERHFEEMHGGLEQH